MGGLITTLVGGQLGGVITTPVGGKLGGVITTPEEALRAAALAKTANAKPQLTIHLFIDPSERENPLGQESIAV